MNLRHFKYEAYHEDDRRVTGSFDAVSQLECIEYLKLKKLKVTKLTETKSIITRLNGITIDRILSKKQLVFFLKQFSSLIDAGFSLTKGLKTIALQQDNKYIRRLYFDIYEKLENGETFSNALKSHPKEFPQMLIQMMEIAEFSGNIAKTMLEMSLYYEKQIRTKTQITNTVRMPIIYLLITLVIAVMMVAFVFPNIEELFLSFENAELPAITVFFLNTSQFFENYGLTVFLLLIVFILGLYVLKRYIKDFDYLISKSILKMPVFGELLRMYNQILIANTLSQMMSNGVRSLQALISTKGLVNNLVYKDLIDETITNIKNGDKFSKSFLNSEYVDPIMTNMIETGENTGELPDLMYNLSNYYDEMSQIRIDKIKNSLQPILLVIVYSIIGIMLLAVMLPMLSLSGEI